MMNRRVWFDIKRKKNIYCRLGIICSISKAFLSIDDLVFSFWIVQRNPNHINSIFIFV